MEQDKKPRVKAMCVFVYNGKTLATKGYDKNKMETFYRLVGGSVDFRERSDDAIRREIQEELKCDIDNLILIKVVENLFTYEGKQGHDVIFLYRGDLSDKALYDKKIVRIVEPYGELEAEWVSIEDALTKKVILYPALDYSTIFK